MTSCSVGARLAGISGTPYAPTPSRLAHSDRIGPISLYESGTRVSRGAGCVRGTHERHHHARRIAVSAGRNPWRSGTPASRSGSRTESAADPVAWTVRKTGTGLGSTSLADEPMEVVAAINARAAATPR